LKSIFCPQTVVKLRLPKIFKLQNRLLLPQFNITFRNKIIFTPFSSHFSKKNISFSDSGYVIKHPQPSSALHGTPPFTGYPNLACPSSRL